MSIYIEPLIAENLILCYVEGATAYRILRLRGSRRRLILAAMAGSIMSVFYPLFAFPLAVSIILKISSGLLLSVILFAGEYGYVRGAIVFYMTMFLYGGCVFMLGCLKYKNAAEAFTKPLVRSWWITVTGAVALYGVIKLMSVAIHRKRDLCKSVYRYRLTLSGHETEGRGFMDTGNRLYDSVSGLPVIVISVKAVVPMLSESELAMLFGGHCESVFKGARKMRCGSLGGKTDMWTIKPDKFEVYSDSDKNILYDVMVGLSFARLCAVNEYNLILHPSML